jgi:hypothetical protein
LAVENGKEGERGGEERQRGGEERNQTLEHLGRRKNLSLPLSPSLFSDSDPSRPRE